MAEEAVKSVFQNGADTPDPQLLTEAWARLIRQLEPSHAPKDGT